MCFSEKKGYSPVFSPLFHCCSLSFDTLILTHLNVTANALKYGMFESVFYFFCFDMTQIKEDQLSIRPVQIKMC